MCEYAAKYFVNIASLWQDKPELLPSNIPDVDTSVAQYTGGIRKVSLSAWFLYLVFAIHCNLGQMDVFKREISRATTFLLYIS